jgi:hypothetical protein
VEESVQDGRRQDWITKGFMMPPFWIAWLVVRICAARQSAGR